MRRRSLFSRRLVVGLAVALLTAVPCRSAAANPAGAAPSSPEAVQTEESLLPLIRVSAERVRIADKVAAAKWRTGRAVDDPERERKVLDIVARKSEAMGIDPGASTAIFRDQIEASKLVQHALHRYWAAHPDRAPTDPPNLADIRPEIDRIDTQLLEQIRDTPRVRAQASCGYRQAAAARYVAHDMRLDALHRAALARALPSVCTSSGG